MTIHPKTPLHDIEVLVLDCQTTGASPGRGHLLEVAWCRAAACRGRPGKIHSHLLQLPAGAGIPRRITALTGIGPASLRKARPAREVWSRLAAEFRSPRPPPAVIHYARFEMPFLRNLHWQCADRRRFPFQPICTHEIARRLFPGLPRRTLRALAGYFGHSAPQLKRAGDHVRATAVIWRKLIALLDTECAVTTVEQLRDFLAGPPPSRSKRRGYPLSRDRRLSLPDRPGIYRFLDPRGQVLYVGKATSLKHRVNSYFQKQKATEKSLEMLTRVREVDVQECGSALEAALLECDEIKKHRPLYNQALQEQDPRVWFASPNMKSVSPRPGRRHPLGPLPTAQALAGVGHLHALLGGDAIEGFRVLDLPRVFGPPDGCFREGVTRFRARHRLVQPHPRALLRLGTRLWREARPEAEEESRHWTAEGVLRALEGVLIRAAHLVRRARWLCWLCEAELAWKSRTGQERRLNLRRGKPVTKPNPPSRRNLRSRQADFDLATYDRLRVLTTELRRIAARGRLALRLTAGIQLDQDALRKVLRWV